MSLYLYDKRVLRPDAVVQSVVFPCVCLHIIKLAPLDLFGVEGEGNRMVAPVGAQGNWIWNANTGEIKGSEDLISKIKCILSVNGCSVRIHGNVATISILAESLESLRNKVGILSFRIPLFLSLHTGIHVRLIEYSIDCMGQIIRCELAGCKIKGKVCDEDTVPSEVASAVSDALGLFGNHSRLLSSLCYYRQALKLDQFPSSEFKSEALVNFYKSIEILFGNKADGVRDGLKRLDLYSKDVESFVVSLVYVRNSMDVAHSALSLLSNDDDRLIGDYIERVKYHIGVLLKKMISKCKDGKADFSHDILNRDRDRERLLDKLRESMA